MGSFNGETEIPYWHWGKITVAAVSTVGERVTGGRSEAHLGSSAVVQVRDSGYYARIAEIERRDIQKYELAGLSDELDLEVRKRGVHTGAEVPRPRNRMDGGGHSSRSNMNRGSDHGDHDFGFGFIKHEILLRYLQQRLLTLNQEPFSPDSFNKPS